jgi:hypothetical protein
MFLINGITGGVGNNFKNILNYHDISFIGLSSKNNYNTNIIKHDLTKNNYLKINNITNAIHLAKGKNSYDDLIILKNFLNIVKINNIKHITYLSSWVVLSKNNSDDYTKSKINAENYLINFCKENKIIYTILRPTIILGTNLLWTNILNYYKYFYFNKFFSNNFKFNYIHVDDVCNIILESIKYKKLYKNKIYNIGYKNIYIQDYINSNNNNSIKNKDIFYFTLIYLIINKKYKLLYIFLSIIFSLKHFIFLLSNISSSLEFIKNNYNFGQYGDLYTINYNFINKYLKNSFYPKNTEEIIKINNKIKYYNVFGLKQNFNNKKIFSTDIITKKFNNIIYYKDDIITVESGCSILKICKFLETQNKTLEYVPEYLYISSGACIHHDIHSSSNNFFSMFDLIKSIKYINKKNKIIYTLINYKNRSTIIKDIKIILNVTFKCSNLFYLQEIKYYEKKDIIYDNNFIFDLIKTNFSLTLQLYDGELLIIKKNKTFLKTITNTNDYKFRHFNFSKLFIDINRFTIDKNFNINGKINCNYNYNSFFNEFLYITEFYINFNNYYYVINYLLKYENLFLSFALRFSKYDNNIYVWIEIVYLFNNYECIKNYIYKINNYICGFHMLKKYFSYHLS